MSDGLAFGNYRLLRRLARGGMAEVFLARQQGVEGFERRVAIKRILPHLSDSSEFRTMFLDEARLAAQLSHPNIIHIYDFGKVDDYYFIAMEYVDGVDLGRLIKQARNSPVPFELIARILADICAGLHYAHNITDSDNKRLNVVHRDVTPQNVLVTYDGIIKVVDFGIAKATWQASRTRPGVVKGKYAYMSPEQVEGRSLDARSDIYSVGICAYELMTGMPLYRRDNVTEAMKEIRDGKPVNPEQHRADIPHELLAVMRRALETSRDARYSSAAAMQLDLERYLKNAQGMATPQLLGDFLRREAPRTNEGEILSEPKLSQNTPAPEAQPRSASGVSAGKGGTAPLSSLKQGVTPAYENLPILSTGSVPASAVGSSGSDPSTKSAGSGDPSSSAEDLTTPGKPLRPPERSPSSSSQSIRAQQPPPPGLGFANASDDEKTKRDTRLPETMPMNAGPAGASGTMASGEQATTRTPKMTPPSGESQLSGEERKRSSSSDRIPKQGGSRSGPFPGNPLGREGDVSDQSRAVLPSDLTAMLNSPPPARKSGRWVPFALLGVLLLAGGGFAAYRYAVQQRGGGTTTSIDPPRLTPTTTPTPIPTTGAAADLKLASDAGVAGVEDTTPHPVTTSLPVQTSATLGVNTRPTGAKVFIDGEPLEMLTPVRNQPITAGPHHVVIERTGYQPRELDVALRAGEHRVLDFELPEERPLDPSGSPTTTTPKKKNTPTPRAGGSGFLTAKTVPWSRAYDGARLLGETPLVSVPLIEGTHTITFVNPDLPPVKRKITVRVGEETRLSFKLDE